MRKLLRRLLLWALPEQRPVVYVIGDPFDVETNPRKRAEAARRIVEGNN